MCICDCVYVCECMYLFLILFCFFSLQNWGVPVLASVLCVVVVRLWICSVHNVGVGAVL